MLKWELATIGWRRIKKRTMKKFITSFLLIYSLSFLSQEIKFVNAPSGLIVRNKPSKSGKRIGKLENFSAIRIIKETGIKIDIQDDGKIIRGHWTQIEALKDNLKGYIFDGFLTNDVLNKGAEIENYYLTTIDSITQSKYWKNTVNQTESKPLFIYLRDKKHQDLLKFPIADLEFYEGTSLKSRKVTSLRNLNTVIIVESSYSACCSNTDEYFYLVNSENNLIKLPELENNHCDGPEPYFTYLFPEDAKGQKDKIICAKIIPQNDGNNKIEALKTFSWDGTNIILENNY